MIKYLKRYAIRWIENPAVRSYYVWFPIEKLVIKTLDDSNECRGFKIGVSRGFAITPPSNVVIE